MKEKAQNGQFDSGIFSEVTVVGFEGRQWMEKTLQVASKYEISGRLGFSKDSPEEYLAVAFLGVRLIKEHQRAKHDLIREAEFTGVKFIGHLLFDLERAQEAITGLEDAVVRASDQYGISINRKCSIERAVNSLTAEFYDENQPKNFGDEVEFKPDKPILKKWERRWKPELQKY